MRAERASRTAQYVAQVRALLDRLEVIDDPYAVGMLTGPNRLTSSMLSARPLRRLVRSPFFAALAARIIFFDRQVEAATRDGLTQIVVIGAGYDSRAWRFAGEGVHFFEVDHPATQRDKRQRAPSGGPVYVAADLRVDTVFAALRRSDFDSSRPTLFAIEGVTMYLTEGEVRFLLTHLAVEAASGSRLAVNFAAFPSAGTVIDRGRQRVLRVLGALGGEAHRFFLHAVDMAPFVESTGWEVTAAVTLRAVACDELINTPLSIDRLDDAAGAVAADLLR